MRFSEILKCEVIRISNFEGENVWDTWKCDILDTFSRMFIINQIWECHISSSHISKYVYILRNLTFSKSHASLGKIYDRPLIQW